MGVVSSAPLFLLEGEIWKVSFAFVTGYRLPAV